MHRNLSITEMGGVVGGLINQQSIADSCYKACNTKCPDTKAVICMLSDDFCS